MMFLCDLNLFLNQVYSNVVLPVSRYKRLDLEFIEPITGKTYGELIAAKINQNLPYLIAIVNDENGGNKTNFDAIHLRERIKDTTKDLGNLINFKVGKIYYFALQQDDKGYISTYLGNSSEEGKRKDFIDLFFKAAENDVQAQFELGKLYDTGFDVDLDKDKAVQCFRLAAQQGHKEAQFYYGFSFYNGDGVKADFDEARKWWQLSATQGDEDAKEALMSCTEEDFEKNQFNKLKQAADNGDATSQYDLGLKLYHNLDYGDAEGLELKQAIKERAEKAYKYFKLAADQGVVKALFNCGECFFYGNGIKASYKEAINLWERGADLGDQDSKNALESNTKSDFKEQHNREFLESIFKEVDNLSDLDKDLEKFFDNDFEDPTTQYELGIYYYGNPDIEDSIKKAIKLWKMAAEQGEKSASLMLAECYEKGVLVKLNLEKAFKYLESSDEDLDLYLNEFIKKHSNMPALEYFGISEAEKKEWLNEIRIDYSNFIGDEEIKTLMLQASVGNANSLLELGNYYNKKGYKIQGGVNKAIHCWSLSAAQGNIFSIYNLGIAYYDGILVEQDIDKAFNYFLMAANLGLVDAEFNVAYMYDTIYKNREDAAVWYSRAAFDGDPIAQYNIANCYYEGKGIEKDLDCAIYWWSKAAEQGDEDAKYNLSLFDDSELV